MSILPLKGDLQEYHSGVLHKVGGKVKTWNKRFFILKSDYCLYYYKDTSKGPLGSISLQDQHFKVRKGEPGDVSWPRQTKMDCTMAIVTSYRTYCFYSDYSHEIIEWIEMLTKAREKWRKKSLTESKSVSSSSIGHTEQQGKMTLGDRVLGLPSEENMNHSKTDEVTSTEALYTFAKPEEVDQPLYEDVGTEKNAENAILYEQITPDDEASNAPVQQPLYDDVHPSNAEHVQDDNTPSPPLRNDPAQPLYDDVHPSQTHADDIAPLLPPRNDIKPAPSLPPRNDSAQPLYDDVHPSQTEDGDITPSPLPPTDDPHIDDDLAPSLPPRDISPLSPRGTIDPYNFVPSPSGTPPSQLTPPSPHNTLPFTLELTPPTQGSPPDSYETPPPSHETLPLPAEGMPHTPTSDGSTDTGSPSSQPTRPVPKPRVKRGKQFDLVMLNFKL